jgi:hypothetical protein
MVWAQRVSVGRLRSDPLRHLHLARSKLDFCVTVETHQREALRADLRGPGEPYAIEKAAGVEREGSGPSSP